jgi:hypothetical protein
MRITVLVCTFIYERVEGDLAAASLCGILVCRSFPSAAYTTPTPLTPFSRAPLVFVKTFTRGRTLRNIMRVFVGGQCPSQQRRQIKYEFSMKSRCTLGSNHPQQRLRLLAHCFALVFLVLMGPRICHACILANLPVSSHSFSGCYGAACSNSYYYSQIKLGSTSCWAAGVRIILTPPPECREYLCDIFLQANNANQWVTLDLGQIALVCGVVTQGRGEFKQKYLQVRFKSSENHFCS